MTKIREDDTRVFPPLPPDSPLRFEWSVDGEYASDHSIYTLRPWPRAEEADSHLVHYIADKGDPDWPEVVPDTDLQNFERWLGDESWAQSWALAVRGANDDFGVSLAFPLLIFKNVQDPLAGGWFVNRIYFQGSELEDFGVIKGEQRDGETYYDDTDREIVRAVAELARFGVGGRNLRVFRTSADREAALLEQILAPALRSRNPERRREAVEALENLAAIASHLKYLLLVRDLRKITS